MQKYFFLAGILFSCSIWADASEWIVNEPLHIYLKSDSNLISKQLVTTENLLMTEGYKGRNGDVEDGKLRLKITLASEGLREFVANISSIAIVNGWTCVATILIEGRIRATAPPTPSNEDYELESLTLRNFCGPD